MDKKIILPFGNTQFMIEFIEEGYATYYVKNDETFVRLGERSLCETKKNVLRAFVNVSSQKTFSYNDINIFHVLNFTGPHASLHALPKDNGSVEVYWSNVNNPMNLIATLTKEDTTQFVESVRQLEDV
ncbi:MAG: hypothetical protein FWG68_12700 [Defluviitaleaceae bacterium]|nr:hypothetical protein [Defluviitaleaceae bacterium]